MVLLMGFVTVQAQQNGFEMPGDTTYTLTNDSLFTNTGLSIVVGQRIIAGEATGINGWYKSIGFKSPFNWSLWLFRDIELKTTYENRDDPTQDRKNDKLKDALHAGDLLLVTKIKKKGNKRRGYVYVVYFRNTTFPVTNFFCNIQLAIKTKELIIQ